MATTIKLEKDPVIVKFWPLRHKDFILSESRTLALSQVKKCGFGRGGLKLCFDEVSIANKPFVNDVLNKPSALEVR